MTSENHFDILVIGGGINGSAIANIAAFNGLSVALIEKNTVGSGTSSKSSKLLHGGLRYLEHGEWGLVREALRERTLQLNSAPSLARSLGFIIPVYEDSPRPMWMMRCGVALYDFLSGRHLIAPHRKLSREEVLYFSPELKKEKLNGGVIYYDAQMDDLGLCQANADSALAQGAAIFEHTTMTSFIIKDGRAIGVEAQGAQLGEQTAFFAKHIIVTAGPWSNDIIDMDQADHIGRVRPTKGVHLVYQHAFCDHALLLQTKDGRRIFFVIPWKDHTLIGTTDTDYEGSPDDVRVDDEDITYLFSELKPFFPQHDFQKDLILESFAGLRPLVAESGFTSRISRRHSVSTSGTGVVYLTGGKYTTYRVMAQDALNACMERNWKDISGEYPLLDGKNKN